MVETSSSSASSTEEFVDGIRGIVKKHRLDVEILTDLMTANIFAEDTKEEVKEEPEPQATTKPKIEQGDLGMPTR